MSTAARAATSRTCHARRRPSLASTAPRPCTSSSRLCPPDAIGALGSAGGRSSASRVASSARIASPCLATNDCPIPLIASRPASSAGRRRSNSSSTELVATVYAGLPSVRSARHCFRRSNSVWSTGGPDGSVPPVPPMPVPPAEPRRRRAGAVGDHQPVQRITHVAATAARSRRQRIAEVVEQLLSAAAVLAGSKRLERVVGLPAAVACGAALRCCAPHVERAA